MNCERCLEQLSARLDGELPAGEAAELEAHLAQCSSCRALAQQLEQLHGDFPALEELEAPAGFAQGVMDRVRTEKPAGRVIPLFRRPQFKALAGLAACAALCIGLYGAGQLGNTAPDLGEIGTDSSIGLYSLAPEAAGENSGTAPAQYDAYGAAPRANAALVDPEAEGAQTDAFDGEGEPPQNGPSQEAFSQVLTLDALPQGRRSCFPRTQWCPTPPPTAATPTPPSPRSSWTPSRPWPRRRASLVTAPAPRGGAGRAPWSSWGTDRPLPS